MENRSGVKDTAPITKQFRSWKDNEASQYAVLEKLLQHSASKNLFEALIAKAILFSIFIFNKASRDENDPKIELVEKTTAEITREVLDDMQLPHPAEQQQVLEQAKLTEVNVIEESFSTTQSSSVKESSSEHLEIAEVFLKQMQEQTKIRDESLSSEMKRLQLQERVVFWGFIIAASITMIIVVIGIILIFNERLAVGIVAEAVGILPGTGTLILNRLSKQVREDINRASTLREDNLKVLHAIQTALLIPDFDKRSDAIVSLAAKLTDRAVK